MKVLFVGGTGIISSGAATLALQRGLELSLLNRGQRNDLFPPGARLVAADYRDEAQTLAALDGQQFDAVVDFITMNAEQMAQAIRIWRGKTAQYIFISSASAYEKPVRHYLITEETPLGNIYSEYARNKIACENVLRAAIMDGFPGVIIRPSLTYSDFNMLTALNSRRAPYTLFDRMIRGRKIVVHGDGLSLWVITHTSDLARGIVGLLGNPDAIGEAFHITTDEVLTWDEIYRTIGRAAGTEANLIHIPSDFIGEFNPAYRSSLLGDHANSVVFDNAKIKRFVPDFRCRLAFAAGARQCYGWFRAHPGKMVVDDEWNREMDELIARYGH